MPAVELRGVSKSFPGGGGLCPIHLTLPAGDRLVLLGPSGSGKSTLLRLIAGLEDLDSGEVWVGGKRVDHLAPHRRGVAMLPQRPALYPHLTVTENIAGVSRETRQRSEAQSEEIAEILGLARLRDRFPHQLSGGERQRVALAKLLARQASVWLLDEPFAALDPVFRFDFRQDLHLLLARTEATIILVTHDPADAAALGRRIGVLGEGRVQQLGTPEELYRHPGTRFVAVCLGQLSLIDGRAVGRAGGGESSDPVFVSEDGRISVPLPAWLTRRLRSNPPHNLTLGIRPEDASPRSSDHDPHSPESGALLCGWPVVTAEPVGSGWLLTLAQGKTRVRVMWRSGSPPPVGALTDWFLPANQCAWFDLSGRRIEEGG